MTQNVDKAERLDKHRTRELILEAAEQAFGDSGVKGATTKEIAKLAGVNETTLFRHFPSKEALLLAVIEKGMQEAELLISGDLTLSGDLLTDMQNFLKVYCHFLRQKEPMLRVCLSTMNRLPEEAKQIFQVTNLPTVKRLVVCFEAAQKLGQMRSDLDCYKVSQAFTSVVIMSVLKENVVQTLYTQEEYFATVLDLFVNGIKPTSDLKGSAS